MSTKTTFESFGNFFNIKTIFYIDFNPFKVEIISNWLSFIILAIMMWSPSPKIQFILYVYRMFWNEFGCEK